MQQRSVGCWRDCTSGHYARKTWCQSTAVRRQCPCLQDALCSYCQDCTLYLRAVGCINGSKCCRLAQPLQERIQVNMRRDHSLMLQNPPIASNAPSRTSHAEYRNSKIVRVLATTNEDLSRSTSPVPLHHTTIIEALNKTYTHSKGSR